MATESSLTFTMIGYADAPAPYDDGISHTVEVAGTLAAGDLAGQVGVMVAIERSLLAAEVQDLDLKTDLDRYGEAQELVELVALYVENQTDIEAGGGTLSLAPGASNGFTNLLGASSAIKLPMGCAVAFFLVDLETAENKWVVASNNKTLAITNTHGSSPARLKVQLWGRR